MTEMTPQVLVESCKKNGGYAQPRLNDQLYLQCRGFHQIDNLAPYENLKVLWLEQNAITDITGLSTLEKLVSLFLQNNTIRVMKGFSGLSNLRILNLSNNYITRIDNLHAHCPLLETLQIAHNAIESLNDCVELHSFEYLSSVDLSFNKIAKSEDEPKRAMEFFAKMPALSVLYMQGNELVHGTKNYRKNMIVTLPQLTYLDERPVFPEERRATEAWAVGGVEAETAERTKIRDEKKAELQQSNKAMSEAAAKHKDLRDRLTKEFEQKREKEREAMKVRRQENKRQVQRLESHEFDARGDIENEEDDAWADLLVDEADNMRCALEATTVNDKIRTQEAEVQRVREEAEEELRREEFQLDKKLDSVTAKVSQEEEDQSAASTSINGGAAASSSEMEKWIRCLEQTDEEMIHDMEKELEVMFAELGSQPAILQEDGQHQRKGNASKSSSGVTTPKKRKLIPFPGNLGRSAAAAVEHEGEEEAAALKTIEREEAESSPATLKRRKDQETIWEKYFEWETRHGAF